MRVFHVYPIRKTPCRECKWVDDEGVVHGYEATTKGGLCNYCADRPTMGFDKPADRRDELYP